jgi:hypothetical protein
LIFIAISIIHLTFVKIAFFIQFFIVPLSSHSNLSLSDSCFILNLSYSNTFQSIIILIKPLTYRIIMSTWSNCSTIIIWNNMRVWYWMWCTQSCLKIVLVLCICDLIYILIVTMHVLWLLKFITNFLLIFLWWNLFLFFWSIKVSINYTIVWFKLAILLNSYRT